jgi:hypothetical protein
LAYAITEESVKPNTRTVKVQVRHSANCKDKAKGSDYGGRGITICPGWLGPDGFQNFATDMGLRPRGKTLDRINPNRNYEPTNARSATPKVQANNKRSHWAARIAKEMTEEQRTTSKEYWKDQLADPSLPAF